MKKFALLAATALTLTSLGAQSLTTLAASGQPNNFSPKGNRVIYVSGCNAQDVLDKLKDCLFGITLPGCQQPGENLPEIEIPDTNLPDSNTPDTNLPGNDNNTEDVTPEESIPENNTPDEAPETNEHAYIRQIVELVNAERAKEGLSPLTIDTKVQAAAQVRAQECEQRFSHTRPNGSSFATALKEQNVSYRSAGENIAWGQRSPQEVMNGWMNSEGHRANIMNPNFTTIGVGYYQNANGTNYWCQLFTR